MKQLLLILCCVMGLTFSSCYNDKSDTSVAISDDDETTVDEIVGKWDRRTAESHYTLYLAPDGTGKLVSYEQATSTTETFRFTINDNKFVAEWGKLKKTTYHSVLTVDGKYLVFDDGSSIFVYKRREK